MRSTPLTAGGLLTAVAVAVVFGVGGCGREAPTEPTPGAAPAAADFAAGLRDQVSPDAVFGHVAELQDIADAHDGNRALGTPGYDASVDYVANALRDAGFEVQTPEFEVRLPFAEDPEVTVGGAPVPAKPLLFTIGTDPEGVSGPLVPARADDDTPGCTADDYDGLPVDGAVVLVDRGHCPFGDKQAVAAERGAVALIVANTVDEEEMGGTLGEDTDVAIPVISVTKSDGARLRDQPGPTTITLDAGVQTERTRNVIAQTSTGSTTDVVMVGAHLDGVPEGPGINDNASGVAAVLETALQLGSAPDINNAVRFGFWGAEEVGLRGSRAYLASLDVEELNNIAMYLNLDMVGSPNPGYFTYDGDQSSPPDPNRPPPRVPEGSAGVERTLVAALAEADIEADDVNLEGRSDNDSFTRAGIPAGGLFTGGSGEMTEEQAQRWGGTAGEPFDPNYHKEADNLDNIDRTALEINAAAAAYAVGIYAQDQRGRNGLPIREDRTRHPVSYP
ncbi:M20/M25/M40 family metallo-hydrolase [Mycolicibacterium thermoresistibile]